jgi:hypothetical protein
MNNDQGFPPRLDFVREIAIQLEHQRTGGEPSPVGKNWISLLLNHHPDLAGKFSTQLSVKGHWRTIQGL